MQVSAAAATAPIPGTYWQWRGHSIYYVKAGKKQPQRPPLLLIHGFGASTDHWRKNITGLCEEFEVWAIDLLGFGRSAKPDIEYSGNLWRDQLHDFITDVIGQPTVLAGNSLGGYAALCVAAEYTESVAGVVLLNSAGPFTSTQPNSQPHPLQKVLGETVQSIFRQPWGSYLLFQYIRQRSTIRRTLEQVYLDKSAVTDQLIEEIYRPSCDAGAARVFGAVFSNQQGEKVDVLLAKLKCHLLLLWGEADPWMNCKDRSAKFRQHYAQLTEHFLRAGHCPHDEVSELVNALIRSWILEKITL